MVQNTYSVLERLFEGLAPESLAALNKLVRLRRLDAGEQLYSKGDRALSAYFVTDGRLAVVMDTGFNGKLQAVALLGKGALVGESAFGCRGVRGATLVAVEDAEVAELPVADLESVADPALQVMILKRVVDVAGGRLAKSSERLAHVL